MGLIEERPKWTYLNVSSGALVQRISDTEKKRYTGIVGVITGVRVVRSEFQRQVSHKLELRIIDPETDTTYIVSGTIYDAQNTVTTWGRMLVARLVNPANKLGQGEILNIGVYNTDPSSKVSFASLRRAGDDTPLQGVDLDPKNPARCRYLVEEAVKRLIATYGAFGSSPSLHDEHDEDTDSPAPHRTYQPPASQAPPPSAPPPDYDYEPTGLGKQDDDGLPF